MAERQLAFSIKVLGSDKQATEIGKIEAELSDLSNRRRELNKQLKEAVQAEGRNSKSAKQLGTALANVKNQTTQLRGEQRRLLKQNNAVSGSYNALSSRMGLLRSRMKDLNLETEEGVREYRRLEKEVLGLNNRLKSLDARVGNSQRNVGNYRSALGGLTNFLKTSVGPAIVGAFAVGSVVAFTKQVVRLNAEMSDLLANVRKTTGLTQVEVEKLADQLERLDTRTSIQGLLKIAEGAGRLGIAQEELAGFVEVVDRAVVALGDDLGGDADQIATDLGKIAGVFGEDERLGTAEALNRIGSAINELGATSRAQAGPIVEITSRLQGFAATADVSVENVLGLSAAMDSLGIRSETGATAVGQFLVAMGQDIPKFAELAGLSVEEFSTILEENAVEAMLLVLENSRGAAGGLEGLAQQLEALGVEGARQGQTLTSLAQNTDEVRRQLKTANDEYQRGTSLTDEFNIKNDNLAASIDKLSKEIENLQRGGGALSDGLKVIVDFVIELIGIFDAWDLALKQVAATISTLQGIAEPLTRLDFSGFIDNIRNIGNIYDNIYDNLTLTNEEFEKQSKTINDQIAVLQRKEQLTEQESIQLEILRLQMIKLTAERRLERAERDRSATEIQKYTKQIQEVTGWITEEEEKLQGLNKEREQEIRLNEEAEKKQRAALERIRQLEEDFATSQLSQLDQEIAKIKQRYNAEIEAAEEANLSKEEIARIEKIRDAEIANLKNEYYEQERQQLQKLEAEFKKIQDDADDFWDGYLDDLEKVAKEEIARQKRLERGPILQDVEVQEERAVESEEDEALREQIATEEERRKKLEEQAISGAIDTAQTISDTVFQIKQQQAERELRLQQSKLEDERQTELSALETRFQQGLLTEEQYRKKRQEIDKEFQQKQRQLEKENFERQKKMQRNQALIAGALAIARAISTPPSPNFVAAGIAAAATGAQVAAIQSQEFPQAEKGAMFEIGGKRHANGGTKFVGSDGSAFEAEQGELLAIVNRRSTDMLKGLSDINVAGGGKRFFQQGGIMPPSPVNLSNNISVPEMPAQKVYILESEMSRSQRKVKVIQQNASI